MRVVAVDPSLDLETRLFELLYLPMRITCEKCAESPAALEMIVAVRPYIQSHIAHFIEEEYVIIASVLDDGVKTGMFHVDDTYQAAKTLKLMCLGFLPSYAGFNSPESLKANMKQVVALAIRGLRRRPGDGAEAAMAGHGRPARQELGETTVHAA
jgi:hypothetical protein